ncbi:MAG: hypothetical protein QME47_02810 [Candidatus Thermoplasmatota archaeon]|nr:hypothetical protein [Candidatus Thermoplasmatota archaeon]
MTYKGAKKAEKMNDGFKIITIEDLAKAIRNNIDKRGLTEEDAMRMARHVLNFFGFNDRIIDNVLEPEDRDAFYTLEEYGLLLTEREEVTLNDGREWRVHYWRLHKDKIFETAKVAKELEKKKGTEDYSVYDELPEEVWKR